MDAYQKDKDEVLKEQGSRLSGLTEDEAMANREQYGPNRLEEGKRKSILLLFLEQFKDFLVIILIVAAVVSCFIGDWESACVIFAVITMNAILGTAQTRKAEASLKSLKEMAAPQAKVIRDGIKLLIPAEEVTVGDVVVLEAGDYIPADGRIVECASLKVSESALTGESLSVEKNDTLIKEEVPLGDRLNMVYSGTYVTYGRAQYVVTHIGMKTEMGKIALLIKNAKEKKTPLQETLDQFGAKLSIIIMIICAVIFGVGMLNGQKLMDAFLFAIALAVAAIPEALSSIVTIVLSFGTQKMAKENAIVRKLQAVEGLGSVSIICSDKTGTLTQNKMTVEHYYCDGKDYEVNEAAKLSDSEKLLILSGILCSDATHENDVMIGDPTEVALVDLGALFGMNTLDLRADYERRSEIPFDSDRKLMSTIHHFNDKKYMITKGAVDVLLNRMNLDDEQRANIERQNKEYSDNGLRVLAFARKEITDKSKKICLEWENDMEFIGLIAMMDPPRVESAQAVAECISAGIKPIMITGDHKITASAIARKIGILGDDDIAVEGAEIDSLSDEELREFVQHVAVYARVSPEHKIRIVRAWQERGNIVSMTGDGVNDAPALRQADVGVAMGITGTEVSKEAASMILTDDNFATIVKAVENGRNVYANIKRSIQFLLSGNAAGILVVVYCSILGLPVPFAAVHLLFINLLTDSLPAIALGLEPHSKAVMKKKPRGKNESILTKDFLIRIGWQGLVIGGATIAAYYIGLSHGGAPVAMTMAFATLCLSRLVHGYNCKADKPVIFTRKFFNNRFLQGAFAVGFLLLNLVLLVQGLQGMFKVAPLTPALLLTVYGLSLANLFVIQLVKKILPDDIDRKQNKQ